MQNLNQLNSELPPQGTQGTFGNSGKNIANANSNPGSFKMPYMGLGRPFDGPIENVYQDGQKGSGKFSSTPDSELSQPKFLLKDHQKAQILEEK